MRFQRLHLEIDYTFPNSKASRDLCQLTGLCELVLYIQITYVIILQIICYYIFISRSIRREYYIMETIDVYV